MTSSLRLSEPPSERQGGKIEVLRPHLQLVGGRLLQAQFIECRAGVVRRGREGDILGSHRALQQHTTFRSHVRIRCVGRVALCFLQGYQLKMFGLQKIQNSGKHQRIKYPDVQQKDVFDVVSKYFVGSCLARRDGGGDGRQISRFKLLKFGLIVLRQATRVVRIVVVIVEPHGRVGKPISVLRKEYGNVGPLRHVASPQEG